MTKTKGIILAGGAGSRLYPLSQIYSKQLVAVFDKPLIYYPLSTLIAAKIREILIISNEETLPLYKKLFNDGQKLGLSIEYAIQSQPNGIAEAFIIGKKFIGSDNVALILGDNIFYGHSKFFFDAISSLSATNNFSKINNKINNKVNKINNQTNKNHTVNATIFALYVNEPERYGVVRFSAEQKPIEIIEKPKNEYFSNFAVPGFYIYDATVVEIAEKLQPSRRRELEITDINNYYLSKGKLNLIKLDSGVTWFDCGTANSLLNANNFIASIEERHGIKIGCPEEEALKMNYINREQLLEYTNELPHCDYQKYLIKVAKNKII